MAIGTLAVCYDNPDVFRKVVKMRRGQSALYMTRTRDMRSVYLAFAHFAAQIVQKCAPWPAAACYPVGGHGSHRMPGAALLFLRRSVCAQGRQQSRCCSNSSQGRR